MAKLDVHWRPVCLPTLVVSNLRAAVEHRCAIIVMVASLQWTSTDGMMNYEMIARLFTTSLEVWPEQRFEGSTASRYLFVWPYERLCTPHASF